MNELLKKLDDDWTVFRDEGWDSSNCVEQYQKLMVRTWPVLLEHWINKAGNIDRDFAKLLCTITTMFVYRFDEERNYLGRGELEDYAIFHNLLFDHIVFDLDLRFIIHGDKLIVDCYETNTSTFEIEVDYDYLDEED